MTSSKGAEFDRSEGIMPATTHAAAAAPTRRLMAVDEAMKAGIAATACSVLIIVIVVLAMLVMPASMG